MNVHGILMVVNTTALIPLEVSSVFAKMGFKLDQIADRVLVRM